MVPIVIVQQYVDLISCKVGNIKRAVDANVDPSVHGVEAMKSRNQPVGCERWQRPDCQNLRLFFKLTQTLNRAVNSLKGYLKVWQHGPAGVRQLKFVADASEQLEA